MSTRRPGDNASEPEPAGFSIDVEYLSSGLRGSTPGAPGPTCVRKRNVVVIWSRNPSRPRSSPWRTRLTGILGGTTTKKIEIRSVGELLTLETTGATGEYGADETSSHA